MTRLLRLSLIAGPGAVTEGRMNRWLGLFLVCVSALAVLGQTTSSKYQPGTITSVKAHNGHGRDETDSSQYDVSVRIGNISYVVLYTSRGSNFVKFSAGNELLFLVGDRTLKFNDSLSGETEVPILSQKTVPERSLDLTRICGQYFSLNLQRLSKDLVLTEEQQIKIRPILEQEAGEVDEICFNPALSQKEQLNRFDKIVRTSDKQILPLLSATQMRQLQDIRKEQQQNAKRLTAEQNVGRQN